MRQKIILSILIAGYCFIAITCSAQSKLKAEKEFLSQLNSILKKSKQQYWNAEGTMTIDSAFAINTDGILSVTVRYTMDGSFVRSRMEVPVNKIKQVAYDLYVILECNGLCVTVYQSETGSNKLEEKYKNGLFHIGAPLPEDVAYSEQLQKALDKLLKYYP